jgi:pyruvate/2-oxoacid:ferredoxin oxidoreductase beta subunit
MVKVEDYGKYETAWCPGCGNFAILEAGSSRTRCSSSRA